MQLLINAQVSAISFDICLITVHCNNMSTLRVIIHSLVYSIKLNMEFIVLNQLLALIKHGFAPGSFSAPDEESPDISGPTTVPSGKHGPFSQVEETAANDAKGLPPDTEVVIRDMEFDM